MNDNPSKGYTQFLSQFPLRQYRKDSIFISPAEELSCVFFLESGTVRKYIVTKYGEKVVMNVFNTPTLLPLSWILNKTQNRYYFEALTPLTVRCIPADDVAVYLKRDPAMVYGLLQQVYSGLEDTQRRVVSLMRGSLRCKVLFELLIEARRSGVKQSDGSSSITISEAELAERAGLSRETVSRALAKVFKSSDLCRRQGRSIIIKDLHELDETLRNIT